MKNSDYELSLLVKGTPVREYGHNGLTFVEGKKGSEFTLKFKNNSSSRILACPSVDGLSVMDGKEYNKDSGGYIIAAYSSMDIKGWRTSLNDVANFVFDHKELSYTSKSNKGDMNCGVLGVQVFSEVRAVSWIDLAPKVIREEHHHHHYDHPFYPPYVSPWKPYGPYWCGNASGAVGSTVGSTSFGDAHLDSYVHSKSMLRSCDMSAAVGVSGPEARINANSVSNSVDAKFNLGTGWGKAEESKVTEATFKRDTMIAQLSLYYSDRAGLEAAGIQINKEPMVVLPQAFGQFCQPPK